MTINGPALAADDAGILRDATSPTGAGVPSRRFHILVEMVDFAGLRRQAGKRGARILVRHVAARLGDALPAARVTILGQALLEIEGNSSDREPIDAIVATVRAAMDAPVDVGGTPVRIGLLLGVAEGAAHEDDVALAERAEAALVERRAAQDVAARTATAQGDADAALIAELDRAIDNDELVLFYQPKVHARRQEIDSAEALIRWQHPVRGLVPPGDFIPAAEAGQLIDRLTLWTIERAIADQARLRDAGYDLRVFINISGQLLGDPAFAQRACDMIASVDTKLGFEVTETSVIRDPASAIANLQRFADIGIRIAIDDYGAGLSSLAYLKQLPARELKIDKLFVTHLTSSNRDPLIVRSTIDLAHALDMEVVAEGVETHAALALLTVMGCDMVQGFLISRPIPLPALISFLGEDSNKRASMETRASFSRLASAWKRA